MADKITLAISSARAVHRKMYRSEPKLLILSLSAFDKIKYELYKDIHMDYRTIPLSVYEGMRIMVDSQKEDGWEIILDDESSDFQQEQNRNLIQI